jgi:hypothetical protein
MTHVAPETPHHGGASFRRAHDPAAHDVGGGGDSARNQLP